MPDTFEKEEKDLEMLKNSHTNNHIENILKYIE